MCEINQEVEQKIHDLGDKVDDIEVLAKKNEQSLHEIKECLSGKLAGNGKPGLVEDVRALKKWAENRAWFERLIIAALVAQTIALVISHLGS